MHQETNARDLDRVAQPLVCGKFELFISVDGIKLLYKGSILDGKEGRSLRTVFRGLVWRFWTDLRVVWRLPILTLDVAPPVDAGKSQYCTKEADRTEGTDGRASRRSGRFLDRRSTATLFAAVVGCREAIILRVRMRRQYGHFVRDRLCQRHHYWVLGHEICSREYQIRPSKTLMKNVCNQTNHRSE